jgi:hypothetical protein
MGLDMYLTGKRYMSKYFDAEDTSRIEKVNEVFGFEGQEDADYNAVEVSFRIGYWRKANQIHQWFVDNCQEGRDECQEAWVGREQLEALRDTCKTVLEFPERAEELLPTQSGFFFGGTDYDDFYRGDLEYTVERIEKILADKALEKCDFYYQSSW